MKNALDVIFGTSAMLLCEPTTATMPAVEHGTLKPAIVPKLIDQKSAAELLGIGLSNFKRLEAEGAFSFKRKMVGSSVRYRNTDVIDYIYSTEEEFVD